MTESLFEACWPWALCLVVAVVVARLLISLSGAKLELVRLRSVHRCEEGSVQSLSFVLTLPFFVMIMMLIVQASQIMIGNVVVHYAAYASARSASVWIPANVSLVEPANCISSITQIDQDELGWQYRIQPGSDKYSKIQQAAQLALCSMGPSRDLGYELPPDGQSTAFALAGLYRGLDPESANNSLINTRLVNKLAYSMANTNLDLTFWHRFRTGGYTDRNGNASERYRDPRLQEWHDRFGMYQQNEIGWQDHITAEVTFNLPLLPGPVRLFAPQSSIDATGNVYVWPLTAKATMSNEGERPHRAYWQEEF